MRKEVKWQRTTRRDARQEAIGGCPRRRVRTRNRTRRSGPGNVTLRRDQASRTFLATAIPIAARMRMMSSFFM